MGSAPGALQQWTATSDPLLREARRLLDTGSVDRDVLLATDREVCAEMAAAVEAALASAEPDPARATEFVLAPPL
jgi:TPP-dependent pyruvate/acetoin dehydrogenase alpha subunit